MQAKLHVRYYGFQCMGRRISPAKVCLTTLSLHCGVHDLRGAFTPNTNRLDLRLCKAVGNNCFYSARNTGGTHVEQLFCIVGILYYRKSMD